MKRLLSFLIGILFCSLVFSDSIRLNDGTLLQGKILDQSSTQITIKVIQEKVIPLTQVKDIDITGTETDTPVIIPKPKQIKWLDSNFLITSSTQIVIPDIASIDPDYIARYIQQQFPELHLKVKTVDWDKPHLSNNPTIYIGLKRMGGFTNLRYPEGYEFHVDKDYIELCGKGSFYGLQTLLQLVKGNSTTGYSIRGVDIVDYPTMQFRALHMPRLTPKTDLNLYKKLVKMAARYKFNTLIIENSGAIKLDKHPEAYDSNGFSKKEIKDLVKYMKEYHFTVIPQLNSAGHVNEWLGTEPGDIEKYHLENIFEDTTKCDLLCPSSESTFQLLFDIYNEMLDVFDHPRYFHAGLDEIHLSEYGTDERCKYKSKPGLFAAYIHRLNEYLELKNVKMLMWSDLLLNPDQFPDIDACNGGPPTDFYKSLALLRSKPIIMDWHYERKDSTPTSQYFKDKGFNVIPVCWYNPENIYNQAQTANNLQLQGMCGSMWNFLLKGYDPNSEIEIMSAPILQAEYMWNPNAYDLDKIPYNYQKVFKEIWESCKNFYCVGGHSCPIDM